MAGLDELRRRYPWPARRPDVVEDWTGWFHGANQEVLGSLLSAKTQVVVELGSLCGLSSRFLVERASNAAIICIDHWQGSAEHQGRQGWDERLPELYERFLRNLWPWRDRLVPMRTTTLEGLRELHALGIAPALIYVDASHDEESMYQDVAMSMDLFPQAVLVGDDWSRGDVRIGVVRASKWCRWLHVTDGLVWHMPTGDRR